jgi:hypothetical protein
MCLHLNITKLSPLLLHLLLTSLLPSLIDVSHAHTSHITVNITAHYPSPHNHVITHHIASIHHHTTPLNDHRITAQHHVHKCTDIPHKPHQSLSDHTSHLLSLLFSLHQINHFHITTTPITLTLLHTTQNVQHITYSTCIL